MADSPVNEGQILAGKYRVEKVLGSGGMGVVVAAWHLELEQRVAVKFLHPLAMQRADTAERFRREARSAAKIRSEHVARVIDIGIMEGGLPYMVMEYLETPRASTRTRTITMTRCNAASCTSAPRRSIRPRIVRTRRCPPTARASEIPRRARCLTATRFCHLEMIGCTG